MHTTKIEIQRESERLHAQRLAVTASLKPLIAQARARGLWLHLAYHDVWVSPHQLERELVAANLCFSPENWSLRDPGERLTELRQQAVDAQHAAWSFEMQLRRDRDPAARATVSDQEC